MNTDSFDKYRDALAAGDDEAWLKLHQKFFEKLSRIAARKLDQRLGGKTDADSVVNSVFKTLFRRQKDGEIKLHNHEHLSALLVTIVGRKCLNRNRFFHQKRRAVTDETMGPGEFAIPGEPTPDDEALMNEAVDRLMSRLNDVERNIISRYRNGDSPEQIVRDGVCSLRSVYRVLERVKGILEAMASEP